MYATVDIKDTDQVREVCSGMYGGKSAHIDGEYCGRFVAFFSCFPLDQRASSGLILQAVRIPQSHLIADQSVRLHSLSMSGRMLLS